MLNLRHFSREDCDTIRRNRYPDLSCDETCRMISEWNTLQFGGRYFEMFAVIYNGDPVGSVSICEHSRSACEIGPDIFPDQRGKGFATAAMELAIMHVREKGYRLVIQQIRKDNKASIGLHEKLGFEKLDSSYFNRKGNEVLLYFKLI